MSNPITPELIASGGSEHDHQAAFFCWAQLHTNEYPCLEFMFAIPNGGSRDKRTGARLKAEGVKPGVPDVMLPASSYRFSYVVYRGLYIEFKVGNNTQSLAQMRYDKYLNNAGYQVVVCYTWTEAADAVVNYLKGE